jgi:hypothetical protein
MVNMLLSLPALPFFLESSSTALNQLSNQMVMVQKQWLCT